MAGFSIELRTYLQKRADKKDARTKMLLGIGHDRILYLGMHYIERGLITHDEFENLNEQLYKPYLEMGGNGMARRIMEDVGKLPVTRNIIKKKDEVK